MSAKGPSILPLEPFDGQIFIDAFRIKWVYSEKEECWKSQGRVNNLPVADFTTTGLLQNKLKYLIDTIPPKGGGFAIVSRPLNRRTIENPDGVLFGNIALVSDSFTIDCVTADGSIIGNKSCNLTEFIETDTLPPGFDINLSQAFLNAICVEIPGGPGPRGQKGKQGATGKAGTGDGPQGDPGQAGKNITTNFPITGVKIVDIDDTTDVAVVDLELNNTEGTFFVTKGQINLPTDSDTPVQQFIITRLNKPVQLLDCLDYKILPSVPCKPGDTAPTVLDPVVAYYPTFFDPTQINNTKTYEPVRANFSTVLDQIKTFYQNKLDQAAEQWDSQIKTFISQKDSEARAQLDEVAISLANCEAIPTLDMCIGLNNNCEDDLTDVSAVGSSPVNTPNGSLALAPLAGLFGLDPATTTPTYLGSAEVSANYNPVFSFQSVAPLMFLGDIAGGTTEDKICDNSCGSWVQYPNGTMTFVPPGYLIPKGSVIYNYQQSGICNQAPPASPKTQIIVDESNPVFIAVIAELQAQADASTGMEKQALLTEIANIHLGYPSAATLASIFQDWITTLADNLNNSFVFYRKTRMRYSPQVTEFPAGMYVFLYKDGGFRQTELNDRERYNIPADSPLFINGKFQKYFVGNEGNGQSTGPFIIINPYDPTDIATVTAPMASTEIGLEIGWVPSAYQDLIPYDYFTAHAFDPDYMQGNAGIHLPKPFTDYNAPSSAIVAAEEAIVWKKMPTIGINDDLIAMRTAYTNSPITNRCISWTTTEPGFFLARVKLAYSITNIFGNLVMPPLKTAKYSSNVVITHPIPAINARPVATGSVTLQVIKLDTSPLKMVLTTDIESGGF